MNDKYVDTDSISVKQALNTAYGMNTTINWRDRVILEKKELLVKTENLVKFINSESFPLLSKEHQELLTRQLDVMREYSCILARRLAL